MVTFIFAQIKTKNSETIFVNSSFTSLLRRIFLKKNEQVYSCSIRWVCFFLFFPRGNIVYSMSFRKLSRYDDLLNDRCPGRLDKVYQPVRCRTPY